MSKLNAFYFHDFYNSHIPEILDETYEKKIYQQFLLRKDLIIADWGSNIGLTAYYFKDFAKQLYCVEPASMHLEALNEMIKYNEIKNITVCPCAISNKNGRKKLYFNPNTTAHSLNLIPDDKKFEEVECITPEEFFKRNKIEYLDFLKWDTEGNESEILISDSFKNVAPKIKVICGEWHPWTVMNQATFKRTFEELGYTFNWNYKTTAATYSAIRL